MSGSEFQDRHVVVTGGAGALGRAVVARLVDAGALCHVPVLDAKELAEFPFLEHDRVSLRAGLDLGEEDAVRSFYEQLPGLWASIHVAGGFAMAPIVETSLADWRRMMDMNATTCFLCCREAIRRIRATAGEGGRIVNVAARPALVPTAGMVAYSASKTAVAALTRALAEEVAAEGIWVNAVAPSIIDTPANRRAMPKADFDAWPKPAELAETIVHLAAPANRVTRGAVVTVYGRS